MPTVWGNIVVPSYVPEEISRRQFFQVLANRGMITKQEALDAVTSGTLPAAIEAIIELIADEDVQWNVRMAFSAQTFKRSNWCVDLFASMQNMASSDTDQLWRDGNVLT